MNKIRLAVAESGNRFLSMIAEIMDEEYDLHIVLQTHDEKHLLKSLKTTTADIILLDSTAPDLGNIATFKNIKNLYPYSKVIAFSQHEHEANAIEMIIYGVKSLIGKEEGTEELFKAIRVVYDGGVYISDHSVGIIQRYLAKNYLQIKPKPPLISEEEKRLIKMITDGLTSKQIGEKLYKSHRTIDDMREKLYQKFEVSNKMELIRLAMKYELQ